MTQYHAPLSPIHHIDNETLMAYSAGNLDEGWTLFIKTHLDYCPVCHKTVQGFEAIGGILVENMEPRALSPSALTLVLGRIENTPQLTAEAHANAPLITPQSSLILPPSLQAYFDVNVDELVWKKPNDSNFLIFEVPITTGQSRTFLLQTDRENFILPLSQNTESTMVLSGSYRNAKAIFSKGDVISPQLNMPDNTLSTQKIMFLVTTDNNDDIKTLSGHNVE